MSKITYVPATGMKAVLIPDFFHAKLKLIAAKTGKTLQESVIEMIKDAVRKTR